MNIRRVLSIETLGYTFGDSHDLTHHKCLVLLQDGTTQIVYKTLERDKIAGTISEGDFETVRPVMEFPQPI